MIWVAFVMVGLAGLAAGWVLGVAYGVHREQEAEAVRAWWIAVARTEKRVVLPEAETFRVEVTDVAPYDQDAP